MLTCGVCRSSITNCVPPERLAIPRAVSGVICISPWAPAADVRPRTKRDSA